MIFDYIDRMVIETLSENSRSSLQDIALKANCSIQTVRNRINKLEEQIGLKHTVEVDFTKIGYTTEFFVRVRFKEGVLYDVNRIKGLVDACPYVQFAALTKGDFDLFLWSIAPSREKYEEEMEAEIRIALDEYIRDWTAHGLLVKRGGFIPVDNEIIDLLKIDRAKKTLIKMLNEDSRTSLTDLSSRLKVSKPTVSYHLGRMSDYVKRFTSFFDSPKEFAYAIRFFQVCGNKKDFKESGPSIYNLYFGEKHKFFNKIIYAVVPDGGMDNFFIEAYESIDELNHHENTLAKYRDKIIRKHISAIITQVLKGKIPVRKLDLSKEIPYLLSPLEV